MSGLQSKSLWHWKLLEFGFVFDKIAWSWWINLKNHNFWSKLVYIFWYHIWIQRILVVGMLENKLTHTTLLITFHTFANLTSFGACWCRWTLKGDKGSWLARFRHSFWRLTSLEMLLGLFRKYSFGRWNQPRQMSCLIIHVSWYSFGRLRRYQLCLLDTSPCIHSGGHAITNWYVSGFLRSMPALRYKGLRTLLWQRNEQY